MTGLARGAVQRYGMTGAAGCPAMVYTRPAFVSDTGVRTGKFGIPIARVMACDAIRTKHPGVIGRVLMACYTGRTQAFKCIIFMAVPAFRSGVRPG